MKIKDYRNAITLVGKDDYVMWFNKRTHQLCDGDMEALVLGEGREIGVIASLEEVTPMMAHCAEIWEDEGHDVSYGCKDAFFGLVNVSIGDSEKEDRQVLVMEQWVDVAERSQMDLYDQHGDLDSEIVKEWALCQLEVMKAENGAIVPAEGITQEMINWALEGR